MSLCAAKFLGEEEIRAQEASHLMTTPARHFPTPSAIPDLSLDQIADLSREFSALQARHSTGRLTRPELKRLYHVQRQLLHNLPTLISALEEALAQLAALEHSTEPA